MTRKAAGKSKSKSRKPTAEKSGGKSPRPRNGEATQFKPGNVWRWPKGTSGNPGGRPKGLSDAYRQWLELPAQENPDLTNAQAIAAMQVYRAKYGDVTAAKEIRQATEGDRLTTWKDEVIALLRSGAISVTDVLEEFPDDGQQLVVAAGLAGVEAAPAEAEGGAATGGAAGEQPAGPA